MGLSDWFFKKKDLTSREYETLTNRITEINAKILYLETAIDALKAKVSERTLKRLEKLQRLESEEDKEPMPPGFMGPS